jgi:putative ABC transport system ATP-binding protein
MEILKVENLVKTYGEGDNIVNAVDNISLSVNKGEFVAIVGASGSGKSTLLHLLGGVDRPTSGKIYIDGNEINNMNNDKLAIFRRRQIGIVYQFYNLIPILTVEENISLPCDLDGNRPDKERMNLILKSFGLFDRRNHLPNELSGGQQQRTSIARALINNPAILLADEPTGNLDSKSTEEIMSILKMSNRDFNQTIIMITHNLEIAKEADRIITIQDGKIVKEA